MTRQKLLFGHQENLSYAYTMNLMRMHHLEGRFLEGLQNIFTISYTAFVFSTAFHIFSLCSAPKQT